MALQYLSGSEAMAQAVKLCRVEVMSAYPITPNTPTLAALSDMIRDGEIDITSVNAESELGAMMIVNGAASVGVRTFNCSASQGLALMKEPLWAASGMALPVVLGVVSRQLGAPQGLVADFSDCFSERDASFVQYVCENNQEIVDNTIIAYKVGENPRILLPAFVVYEGFRLTHSFELLELPDQEMVDRFLPKYDPKHAFIDKDYPIIQGSGAFSQYYGAKYGQYRAMLFAKEVIKEAYEEWGKICGRNYSPFIETYRTEDAELVMVGMGTMVSVLREVVDNLRAKGKRVGMLKIRIMRPFPEDEVAEALKDVPHAVVIDRAVSPGRRGGISYIEVASCLNKHRGKLSNYIIGGNDVDIRGMTGIVEDCLEAKEPFFKWWGGQFEETALKLIGVDNYKALVEKGERKVPVIKDGEAIMAPGTTTCAGCISLTCLRQALSVFDHNTVVTNNSGCLMAASGMYPLTAFKVPHLFFSYSHAGAAASGIETALRRLGKDMKVFLYGGDGGILDIGLQSMSAALERGHDIVFLCYDNEAYMNTGVQRSGSTPWLAKTKTTPHGKAVRKKNIMKIVEAHGDVYAATGSPAFPEDFKRKLMKARETKRPAFLHVICPCPTGWEFDDEKGIEIARLAVETNFFPLYEYDRGVVSVQKLTKEKKPVEVYFRAQGRFAHLSEAEVAEYQKYVDQEYEELLLREEMGKRHRKS